MLDYNDIGRTSETDKPTDEIVVVEITKDKMLGVISFKQPTNGGKVLTQDQVFQKISDAGIKYGISKETVEEILKTKRYNHKYLIAQGIAPIHGKDGELIYHFDVKTDGEGVFKPKENSDGTVNFKDLDLIQTVQKDQLLMEIKDPVEGEMGKNVLGQDIRFTPGKIVRLPKGKNTYISQDGKQLFSSIEGQLIYEHNMITISETYMISGNVGVATGNVNFQGNVIVKGNVESGFEINAGGNVDVMGFVEEATIVAGGNIILRYGIQGKDQGKLISGKDVVAKFIQNSTVEAKGSVHTEAIMHSKIVAGDSILVEANKGLIVGGHVQATNVISAKIIGSPMSTATTVEISVTLSLDEKYKKIDAEINSRKEKLSQLEKNIGFIQSKLAQGVQLSLEKMKQAKQMLELQQLLKQEMAGLEKEHSDLEEMVNNYKTGSIKVRDVMYPGCKIVMGSQLKYVQEDLKYCEIMIEDREIKIGTYM